MSLPQAMSSAPPLPTWRIAALVLATLVGLTLVVWLLLDPIDLDCALQPRACAIHELAGARTFWGADPWEGALARPVREWQRLARAPAAAARFEQVLRTAATPAGELYGLAGLYATDSRAFALALPAFLKRTDSVAATIGCRPTTESVARLAAEIAQGVWTQELGTGVPQRARVRRPCAT